MRNIFPKRPSGASLHTLSKLNDVNVHLVMLPPSFEAVYCFILQSPKDGCCFTTDDLSCSWQHMLN